MQTSQNPGGLSAGGGHTRGRGLSAYALKWVAIAAMLVDHAAYAFVPEYYGMPGAVLHTIGRITAPIMFYFVAEGYHHTRNANRYTLRMAVFAAVSYLPFVWFAGGFVPSGAGYWLNFSVIYTLLLGLLAVRARHEIQNPLLKALAIVALMLLAIPGDWGYLAVILILLFDVFYGSFKLQACAYGAFAAWRVFTALETVYTAGMHGGGAYYPMQLYWGQVLVSAGMFLPLVFLYFYNGKRGGSGAAWQKWLFYIFYPLHLLLIALAASYI